jgi:hypothetical protein
MSNDTVRASAAALPQNINRRALFGRGTLALSGLALAAAMGLVVPLPSTAAPSDGDAEIIALCAEVLRLNEIADKIAEERIDPFNDEFMVLLDPERGVSDWDRRSKLADAFSQECGRNAAIDDQRNVDEEADRHFRRMMAIPATTQPGRAAKVRALLVHVLRSDWRGDAKEIEWPEEQARTLLAEFAGMSAEEIADV